MEKPANSHYPLNPLIRNRWSPRAFEDRPVESWKICSMLEAARWAPSCFNEQPWRFIVGSVDMTPRSHELIGQVLMEGNNWAKKAPVLMLSVAKLHFEYNGKPNRHAQHDVGLAVENLVIQAMDLGLQTHQMAGFHLDKAHDLLAIPRDTYEPMAVIAIGYPGSADLLEGELRNRELSERERQPLQSMVFNERLGVSYPVCFT